MKLLQLLLTMVCIFGATAAHAAEDPAGKAKDAAKQAPEAATTSAENVALVKGLIVTGTLTKIIGNFKTYGDPGVGNTFEIDLTNLPNGKIEFTRTPSDPSWHSGRYVSYIPFSGPLTIEKVLRKDSENKPGRAALHFAAIHLSAIDARTRSQFLIYVEGKRLEKGSKVIILFYKNSSHDFIGSMAEAEGVLK